MPASCIAHIPALLTVDNTLFVPRSTGSALLASAHTSLHTNKVASTESPLYQSPAPAPQLQAVPSEKQFAEAFQALGVHQSTTLGKSKGQQADIPTAAEPNLVKGTMYRLQLLLRTFVAVCRYQHRQVCLSRNLCLASVLWQMLLSAN